MDKLKLYHVSLDEFILTEDYIVAETEEQARDIFYKKYCGTGINKKYIGVYEVTTDEYNINLTRRN